MNIRNIEVTLSILVLACGCQGATPEPDVSSLSLVVSAGGRELAEVDVGGQPAFARAIQEELIDLASNDDGALACDGGDVLTTFQLVEGDSTIAEAELCADEEALADRLGEMEEVMGPTVPNMPAVAGAGPGRSLSCDLCQHTGWCYACCICGGGGVFLCLFVDCPSPSGVGNVSQSAK